MEAQLPLDAEVRFDAPETARRDGRGVALIACGALAREIRALIALNGWRDVTLRCLPALLHNRPERIPERVRAAVRAARADGFAKVVVVYADCGTGGALARVCAEEGVEMAPGPHCYALFDGATDFAARAEAEIGAFYLTDFLARQFDTLVWRGLGLDRAPELRDLYFAHYDRVVLLAQTPDDAVTAAAQAAAAKLGLPLVRRETGYGDLGVFLAAQAGAAGPAADVETAETPVAETPVIETAGVIETAYVVETAGVSVAVAD